MGFKPLEQYEVGDTICDMHYGVHQLTDRYKIVSHIRCRLDSEQGHAISTLLGTLTGKSYENKYLRVVTPVGWDDHVMGMYLYDGRTFGIIVLGPKDEAGQ